MGFINTFIPEIIVHIIISHCLVCELICDVVWRRGDSMYNAIANIHVYAGSHSTAFVIATTMNDSFYFHCGKKLLCYGVVRCDMIWCGVGWGDMTWCVGEV